MDRVIENGRNGNPAEAERLTHELAQIARSVAEVLTRPHTADEVAVLDSRAARVRQALNAVRPPLSVEQPEPIELTCHYTRIGPLCGG